MKKTLVALALGTLLGTAQAQTVGEISATGNLVNSTPTATTTATTWQNVGSWNQGLPCWSPQDAYYGAYCGPQPYFNNGSFNFSWGLTDVYQSVNIAAALPNSGTGLRVTGYNFGFLAKNGNGWDGAGLDYLSAYVRFADKSGKTVEDYYYNLNYVFDWTQFNFSKNFNTPYPTAQLSTATYGFVGGDSNGWAGPYGPEIGNISFSLKYDVDPCASNPLYSPTCAGFSEAMAKLTAAPVLPVAEPVATVTASTAEPVVTSAPTVVAIAPLVAVTTPTPAATTTTTVAAPATRSITANNSTAVAAAMRAVAETQATVATVLSQAQESAVASQSQDTNTVSQDANAQTASSTGSALGTGLTMSFGFQVPGTFVLPGTQLNVARSSVDSSSASTQTTISTPDMPSLTAAQSTAVTTDNTTSETSPTSTRALAAMSNPQMMGMEETTTAPGASSVRNVAPPTELAGGPDIGQMAVAPQGFSAYLTAQLRDAAFYPPREVYRGQINVDNARALRGLGSDSRHQEMVNQQYRK